MAFVISDGALAGIGVPISQYGIPGSPRGISIGPRAALTYGQIYRVQPAVRTVVDFLARNIAGLGLQTFQRVSDTDRTRLDPYESVMAGLLELTPNPSTTAYRHIHSMISDRAIYDAAYWLKVRDTGGRTVGLRRIPVPRIAPSGGTWYEVTQWRIYGTKGFMDVPADQVVTFTGYDPDDTRKGVSPIETLRAILAEEFSATEYRRQLWDKGARTSGVIQRPADADEWSNTARLRFLADWAAFEGGGPGAGGAPILEDGMTWVASGVTPKEAQYVESRKLTREETASAYHIPPPLVGILDHATFSNIQEQHIQLYVDTLGPWMTSSEQEVMLQIVADFYPPSARVYVEFNIAAKLKGDFAQQAAQLQSAVGAPYMTRNEARGRVNLNAVDGGDELVTPLNVIAGGQASPQDSAPPPKAGTPVRTKAAAPAANVTAHIDALTATFGRQQRSVLSRWQQSKARKAAPTVHDLYDRTRWDTELSGDLLKLALPLSAAVGALTAASLAGDDFDPDMTVNYLTAQTAGVASGINQTTQNQVGLALTSHDVDAALAAVFALAIAQRAGALGRAQATSVAGWSSTEAGRQSGDTGAMKRWLTGAHPRESHAKMNGESVPLEGKFSNGGRWPADGINLDVDDVAGCNCSLEIIPGGTE